MKKGRWIQLYYNRQGKRYRDIRVNKMWESAKKMESGKWEEMSEGTKERRVRGRVGRPTLAFSG